MRYTVPAESTLATITYAFTSTGGASYFVKNGGSAVVASQTGTITVACSAGAVDVFFYVRGNSGSVPLTVNVTYAA